MPFCHFINSSLLTLTGKVLAGTVTKTVVFMVAPQLLRAVTPVSSSGPTWSGAMFSKPTKTNKRRHIIIIIIIIMFYFNIKTRGVGFALLYHGVYDYSLFELLFTTVMVIGNRLSMNQYNIICNVSRSRMQYLYEVKHV